MLQGNGAVATASEYWFSSTATKVSPEEGQSWNTHDHQSHKCKESLVRHGHLDYLNRFVNLARGLLGKEDEQSSSLAAMALTLILDSTIPFTMTVLARWEHLPVLAKTRFRTVAWIATILVLMQVGAHSMA